MRIVNTFVKSILFWLLTEIFTNNLIFQNWIDIWFRFCKNYKLLSLCLRWRKSTIKLGRSLSIIGFGAKFKFLWILGYKIWKKWPWGRIIHQRLVFWPLYFLNWRFKLWPFYRKIFIFQSFFQICETFSEQIEFWILDMLGLGQNNSRIFLFYGICQIKLVDISRTKSSCLIVFLYRHQAPRFSFMIFKYLTLCQSTFLKILTFLHKRCI